MALFMDLAPEPAQGEVSACMSQTGPRHFQLAATKACTSSTCRLYNSPDEPPEAPQTGSLWFVAGILLALVATALLSAPAWRISRAQRLQSDMAEEQHLMQVARHTLAANAEPEGARLRQASASENGGSGGGR